MTIGVGRAIAAMILACAAIWASGAPAGAQGLTVTRATLSNGLRVVVVHDPLAPVVTTVLNYEVGSDEQHYDGQAHAIEHMMFRGSQTLSTNQLMESIGATGGNFNADTQNAVTQYFFTLPSQYIDIALRLERSRATGLLVSQAGWDQERHAITQEVTRDESDTVQRLLREMQRRVLVGSVYAKNGLGTRVSFEKQIEAPALKSFYQTWYHPNNAVYIIAGDVDGPSTIAKVRALFGDIPAGKLPKRTPVTFKPLGRTSYTSDSDLPVSIGLIGYRLPGYDNKDYAASQILASVLSSPRGDLANLVAAGKSYQTGFFLQPYNKASVGVMYTVIPIGTKPETALGDERAILDTYRKNGVPADLVEAAKRRVIANQQQRGNSIDGLAFQWSTALAIEHLNSPDDLNNAYQNVTAADVTRVLRTYVTDDHSVTGVAVPKPGAAPSFGQHGGGENVSVPPSKQEPLPPFAQRVLDHLSVPAQTLNPTDMTLSNGVRLIVQPESITHSVVAYGFIKNNSALQQPAGKDGVSEIVNGILPFGTTTYDRIGLQKQFDAIAANVEAGTTFSLRVLSDSFDRGVELLADEELHPAFPQQAFTVLQSQAAKSARDSLQSPDYKAQRALDEAMLPAGDPGLRETTPETVNAIKLDDVKAYYQSVYRPDMTTIVVVGDITPDRARAAFEKYFGAWKAVGPKPVTAWPDIPLNAAKAVNIPAPQRQQASVHLEELTTLRRSSADYPYMALVDTALTGGFYSSLLYHDLREVHGYVYTIASNVEAGKSRSFLSFDYGSDPDKVLPAQNDLVAILKQVQASGLSADRLQRAKALMMGAVPIEESSYAGVADVLGGFAGEDLPLNQNILDAQLELNATNEQIKAAANKYYRPDAFIRVVTGPVPK